jgi:hypothetical protein
VAISGLGWWSQLRGSSRPKTLLRLSPIIIVLNSSRIKMLTLMKLNELCAHPKELQGLIWMTQSVVGEEARRDKKTLEPAWPLRAASEIKHGAMMTSQSHLTVILAPKQNTTILNCELSASPCSEQANHWLFDTLVIISRLGYERHFSSSNKAKGKRGIRSSLGTMKWLAFCETGRIFNATDLHPRHASDRFMAICKDQCFLQYGRPRSLILYIVDRK